MRLRPYLNDEPARVVGRVAAFLHPHQTTPTRHRDHRPCYFVFRKIVYPEIMTSTNVLFDSRFVLCSIERSIERTKNDNYSF
jgi:hypothetical protein